MKQMILVTEVGYLSERKTSRDAVPAKIRTLEVGNQFSGDSSHVASPSSKHFTSATSGNIEQKASVDETEDEKKKLSDSLQLQVADFLGQWEEPERPDGAETVSIQHRCLQTASISPYTCYAVPNVGVFSKHLVPCRRKSQWPLFSTSGGRTSISIKSILLGRRLDLLLGENIASAHRRMSTTSSWILRVVVSCHLKRLVFWLLRKANWMASN